MIIFYPKSDHHTLSHVPNHSLSIPSVQNVAKVLLNFFHSRPLNHGNPPVTIATIPGGDLQRRIKRNYWSLVEFDFLI